MTQMQMINKVSRWPSAFVAASGAFTPIDQKPLIHSEGGSFVWPAWNRDEVWSHGGCEATRELISDTQFMAGFNQGVSELDRGEGVSWEECKSQLGI